MFACLPCHVPASSLWRPWRTASCQQGPSSAHVSTGCQRRGARCGSSLRFLVTDDRERLFILTDCVFWGEIFVLIFNLFLSRVVSSLSCGSVRSGWKLLWVCRWWILSRGSPSLSYWCPLKNMVFNLDGICLSSLKNGFCFWCYI